MAKGIDLLTHKNLDICAKTLYGRAYLEGWKTDWPREVYLGHLKHWNGFVEKLPETKSGRYEFLEAYQQLLLDMKEGKYDATRSPIPLDDNGELLNGRHRVAGSIVTGAEIATAQGNYWNGTHGQVNSNYDFFLKQKAINGVIPRKYLDAMAMEFCRLKPVWAILFFRPVTEEGDKFIHSNLGVVYKKRIELKNDAPYFLMREVYHGEKWLTDTYSGAKEKADLCYDYDYREVTLYLVTSPLSAEWKELLRKPYSTKHSVHGCDTTAESVRIARLLLNDNGVHFINHAKPNLFPNYERLKREYSLFDTKDLVLVGSAPLAAYGLRDVKDFDFLGERTEHLSDSIHTHEDQRLYYGIGLDNLIHNPNYHFWWNGVRYASLDLTRKMKVIRSEAKDAEDVKLIGGLCD